MPGLAPGMHEFLDPSKDVDGRDKPGHDESWICWADAVCRSKWRSAAQLCCIAAVVASLIPANMQIRTGLHWQVEHFLVYFFATSIFCLAWPRPFIVAGVMMAFAALLEALQGLTPDRTPDLPTALSAAAGALTAACWPSSSYWRVSLPWRGQSKSDVSLRHGEFGAPAHNSGQYWRRHCRRTCAHRGAVDDQHRHRRYRVRP